MSDSIDIRHKGGISSNQSMRASVPVSEASVDSLKNRLKSARGQEDSIISELFHRYGQLERRLAIVEDKVFK